MNETKTTTTAPRFQHVRTSAVMRSPLPAELAAKVPGKLRRDHEALVGRVDESSREFAALRTAIAEAPGRDHEAAAQAALEGAELPEPSEPKLRALLEEAERVHAALESALRTSADRLLAAAAAHADEVAGELERQLGDRVADVRARLADLQQAVAELDRLYASAAWVRWLAEADEGARVSPFRAGGSAAFTATTGELTTAEQAFTHDVDRIEERKRAAADERVRLRQVNEQWQRERAGAAERSER
jgi:hypothetical protein